jgi:predicted DNA-binding transcriptional regulator YafY
MSDTTLRHLAMLLLIPGRPGKRTAAELRDKLEAGGHPIDVRSVQRDLIKLSASFPLECDEGKPAGWFWQRRNLQLSIPGMDLGTALTYELLARYLAPILPRGMIRDLEPYFRQARSALDALQSDPLGRWSKRIAVITPGQQLIPPAVSPEVREIVYEALLRNKRFEVGYRSLDSEHFKPYVVNPLGLVYRQGVLYLVATLWEYPDIRLLVLHRMSGAKLRGEDASSIDGFDFERYVQHEKSMEYPAGKDVALELIVEPWLARHLEECRLSENQVVTQIRQGSQFRVKATVPETEQLYWWLSGLGTNVEVRKPASGRRRMRTLARELGVMYDSRGAL